MDTFGLRLRDAMLAKFGTAKPEKLASVAMISGRMARRWLRLRDAPRSALRLALASEAMDVRTLWLVTGRGIPQPSVMLRGQEREAVEIADGLTTGQFKKWAACGRKLADK